MVDYKLRWLCNNVTRTFCRKKMVIVLREIASVVNKFYPPLLEDNSGYIAINNDGFVTTDSGHDVYMLSVD